MLELQLHVSACSILHKPSIISQSRFTVMVLIFAILKKNVVIFAVSH